MPRVDAIWRHPAFQKHLATITSAERDRRFCRHDLTHLMDVARIMWIGNLEQGFGLDRELVYACALLHDIGRAAQYETGEPHEEAGVRIAGEILGTVDESRAFSAAEREMLLDAISGHRGSTVRADAAPLARLLKAADKASRPCFACPVRTECYWPEETKNLAVRI